MYPGNRRAILTGSGGGSSRSGMVITVEEVAHMGGAIVKIGQHYAGGGVIQLNSGQQSDEHWKRVVAFAEEFMRTDERDIEPTCKKFMCDLSTCAWDWKRRLYTLYLPDRWLCGRLVMELTRGGWPSLMDLSRM